MPVSVSFERESSPRCLEAPDVVAARMVWAGAGLWLERLGTAGGLEGCLACGHPELYTQRRFPRWLGLGIVVLAAAFAPATHYLSLLGAAGVDALLYRFAPTRVVCYRCSARHLGFAAVPRHPRFDIGIAERLRFGPKAVMGTPMRPGGTAGAPEPEH
jgi:hypothetical protein